MDILQINSSWLKGAVGKILSKILKKKFGINFAEVIPKTIDIQRDEEKGKTVCHLDLTFVVPNSELAKLVTKFDI